MAQPQEMLGRAREHAMGVAQDAKSTKEAHPFRLGTGLVFGALAVASLAGAVYEFSHVATQKENPAAKALRIVAGLVLTGVAGVAAIPAVLMLTRPFQHFDGRRSERAARK